MSEITLTSLSSELLDITLRNETFEKRIENLKLKIAEFSECSKRSKQCVAYLLDLQKETQKKSVTSKQDVKNVISFFNSLMESSISAINDELSELDKLTDIQSTFSLENSKFRKLLDFPYESAFETIELKKAHLKNELDAKTKLADSTKSNIEVLKKQRDAKKREIEKSRKNSAEMDALLLSRKDDLEKRKSDKQVGNKKIIQEYLEQLKIVEASNEKAQNENQVKEKEIEEMESQLASVVVITEEKHRKIEEIDALREKVENTNDLPYGFDINFDDDEELKKLREECQDLDNSLEEFTDAEIEQLQKEIRTVQEVNAQLKKELQESDVFNSRVENLRNKIKTRNIEVRRLQSELNAYEEQVMDFEKQQHALKTPNISSDSSSDFKASELAAGKDNIYPGIQRINTVLRQRLEMETTRRVDNSFQSSFDSSRLSSEFGTTDNSMMGGIFSPVRDKTDDAKTAEPSTANDFSMMDHFKKFTQNKNEKTKKGARPRDHRFSRNMFLESPRSEFSTPVSTDNSMIVSTLNTDHNGSEDNDEDNSLLANESDMDQSNWNDF